MPRNDGLTLGGSYGEVDISRMTDRARGILRSAADLAVERGAASVEPEHLLLALAMEEGGVAGHVLRFLGGTPERIEGMLRLPTREAATIRELAPWSMESMRCLARAREESAPLGHDYVGTEHLILGIVLSGEGRIPQILSHLRLAASDIRDEVYQLLGHKI